MIQRTRLTAAPRVSLISSGRPSSVANTQPTTLPGWMRPSALQNWRSRRKRDEVSAGGMASISRAMVSKRSFQRAMLASRRSTHPACAHDSTLSRVISTESLSVVTGGILHSGPRSRRPSGSRIGMPMERIGRRTSGRPTSAARRAHISGAAASRTLSMVP